MLLIEEAVKSFSQTIPPAPQVFSHRNMEKISSTNSSWSMVLAVWMTPSVFVRPSSLNLKKPQTLMSAWVWTAFCTKWDKNSGKTLSSLSTKAIYSKVSSLSMRSKAAFLAAERPPFFCRITTKRVSFDAHSSRIAPDSSVEPSSTAKTVKLVYVCVRMESRHSLRYGATLYTGTTIATFGCL